MSTSESLAFSTAFWFHARSLMRWTVVETLSVRSASTVSMVWVMNRFCVSSPMTLRPRSKLLRMSHVESMLPPTLTFCTLAAAGMATNATRSIANRIVFFIFSSKRLTKNHEPDIPSHLFYIIYSQVCTWASISLIDQIFDDFRPYNWLHLLWRSN